MAQQFNVLSSFLFALLFIPSIFASSCEPDYEKLKDEKRSCPDSCSDSEPCSNPEDRCLCDGACGFVCVPPNIKCPGLASIRYGSIKLIGDRNFQSKATYSCSLGFELVGLKDRYCHSDGMWTEPEAFCALEGKRCRPPEFEVQNAHIADLPIKDEYYVGSTVRYQCKFGFSPSKRDILYTKCEIEDDETHWTPLRMDCKVIKCEKPADIENGFIIGKDYSWESEIEYRCNHGYYLEGIAKRFCSFHRDWSGTAPTCEIMVCEKPDDIEYGIVVHPTPLEHQSIVRYECNKGYSLSGPKIRTCDENGYLTGSAPRCVARECEPPTLPVNGKIKMNNGTKLNDIVEYVCDDRTITSGETRAICQLVGTAMKWSNNPPICLKPCVVADLPNANLQQNGKILAVGDIVKHGETLNLVCKDKHEFPSARLHRQNSTVTRCDFGRWSSNMICIPERCFGHDFRHEELQKRKLRLSSDTILESFVADGTKIPLECDISAGFVGKTGSVICDKGKWKYPELDEIRCQEKSCDVSNLPFYHVWFSVDKKTIIPRRQKTVESGKQIHLECRSKNFEVYIDGKIGWLITCNDGVLSSKNIECKPGRCRCSDLRNSLNDKRMESIDCKSSHVKSGLAVAVQCSKNFYGDFQDLQATCINAEWNLSRKSAICQSRCSCILLRLEDHFYVKDGCIGEIDSGKILKAKCEKNFLGDEIEIECQNGRWKVGKGFCSKIKCKQPEIPQNGRIKDLTGTNLKDKVEYECDYDTTTYGPVRGVCELDGKTPKWSIEPPSCIRNCLISHIPNAYIMKEQRKLRVGEYVKHGEVVEFLCENGFEIMSTQLHREMMMVAKCDVGTWSRHIKCEPARCFEKDFSFQLLQQRKMRLSEKINDFLHNDDTVPLECDPGYPHLVKDGFVLCNKGTWIYPADVDIRCDKPHHESCDISHFAIGNIQLLLYGNKINPTLTEEIRDGQDLEVKCRDKGFEVYIDNKLNSSIVCKDGVLSATKIECRPGRCKCLTLSRMIASKWMESPDCDSEYVASESTLSVRCSQGFSSSKSDLEAVCSNSAWEGLDEINSVCSKKCSCSDLKLEENSFLMSECEEEVEDGTVLVAACDIDFTGGQELEAVCKNGAWAIDKGFCHAPCSNPNIPNGFIQVISKSRTFRVHSDAIFQHGETVYINCEEGFSFGDGESVKIILCDDGVFNYIPECISNDELETATTTTKKRPIEATTPPLHITSSSSLPTRRPFRSTKIPLTKATERITASRSTKSSITTPGREIRTTCEYKISDYNLLYYVRKAKHPNIKNGILKLDVNEKILFRCSDVSVFALEGDNVIKCTSSGLKGTLPKCKKLLHRSRDSAPVITYEIINGENKIGHKGIVFVEKGSTVILNCWWFQSRGEPVWKWNGNEIYKSQDASIDWNPQGHLEFTVHHFTRQHNGKFSCTTPNDLTHAIEIRVIEKQQGDDDYFNGDDDDYDETQEERSSEEDWPTQPTLPTRTRRMTTIRTRMSTTRRIKVPPTRKPFATTTKIPAEAKISTTELDQRFTVESSSDQPFIPPKDSKDGFPCKAGESVGKVVFENGKESVKGQRYFPDGSVISIHCKNTEEYFLDGNPKISCKDGLWSHPWPQCNAIVRDNWFSRPSIKVESKTQIVRMENGEFWFPKGSQVELFCDFHKAKPHLYLNGKEISQNSQIAEIHYDDVKGFYIRLRSNHAASYEFKCALPHIPINPVFSNSVVVRFGDTCKLDEGETLLNWKGGISPWSKRFPFYIEDDQVDLKCFSAFLVKNIPDFVTCQEGGFWEKSYSNSECQ